MFFIYHHGLSILNQMIAGIVVDVVANGLVNYMGELKVKAMNE